MMNKWISNSRKVYLWVYLMIIILIAIIVFIKFYDSPLNNFVLIGVGIFIVLGIFFTELHRQIDSYKITSNYLMHSNGILSKETRKILIQSIVDIDLRQNFWQRLLNYGTIDIHSVSGANLIKVEKINKPNKFVDVLETRMNEGINKIYKKQF